MAACRALSEASAAAASGDWMCVVMLVPSIVDGPRWARRPLGPSASSVRCHCCRIQYTKWTDAVHVEDRYWTTGRGAGQGRDLRPEVGHGTTRSGGGPVLP